MTSTAAQPSPVVQFTLRSLWIKLTVACVLFGFVIDAYHTVQTRKALVEDLRDHSAYILTPFAPRDVISSWYAMHRLVPPRQRGVPLVRQMFGDEPIVLIEPKVNVDTAMIARLRRYFPEAIIIRNGRQALD